MIKRQFVYTVTYFTATLFVISLTFSCKLNKVAEHEELENEIQTLQLGKEELQTIKERDPRMLKDIIAFRRANDEEAIEVTVVNDFINLEKCRTPDDCDYLDLPNDFQSIFDFYLTFNEEKSAWMADPKNSKEKNLILHFLVTNMNKKE